MGWQEDWHILDSEMSRAVAVVGRCVAWTLTLRPSRTTHSVTLIDALPLQQKHSRKGDNCAASQLEGSPTSHKSLSASTRRPTTHPSTNSPLPQPPLDSATRFENGYFVDCWQFGDIFTADAQKLLYSSFRSKFWQRRKIQQSRF